MIPETVSVPKLAQLLIRTASGQRRFIFGHIVSFQNHLDRSEGGMARDSGSPPPQLTGRACARPVHTLPITWLLLLGGHRRSRLRGRVFRRRLLYPARELLQPPDLIEARLQIRVLRVRGRLPA